jgi:sensor histidine kinase YesM
MIIQTFAENAVKHGLVQKSGKGQLSVLVSHEKDFILITVDDNGIGLTESQKFDTNSTGRGLVIIKEYIELFNRFNQNKISLDIIEKQDGTGNVTGTLVKIKLPNNFSFNPNTKTT